MYKNRILNILIAIIVAIGLVNFSYATESSIDNTSGDDRFHKPQALSIPEKDINFKIENLTMGSIVYLMIPNDLIDYNMSKFIENNIENEYTLQKQKAEKIKEYYDNKDYLGYIDFLKEEGHNIDENSLEIRHYGISIGDQNEIVGYVEYNDLIFIQLKLNLKNSEFKLIMKDYLVDYDCSKITFLIDEYGTKTYIPVSEYAFIEKDNLNECNITYTYYTNENYEEINKSISIAYTIIFAILILIILVIIIHKINKHKKNKLEIEKRLFWKEKSPKVQKALDNERIKEEIKEIKQKRKNRKKK